MLIEVDREPVPPAPVEYCTFGGSSMATHNYLCPQCVQNKAVLGFGTESLFQPCHECRSAGWVLVRATGWKKWALKKLGLIGAHR